MFVKPQMASQDSHQRKTYYDPSEMLKDTVQQAVDTVVSIPANFLKTATEQIGLSNSEELYTSKENLAENQGSVQETRKASPIYENLYDTNRIQEQRQIDGLLTQLALEMKKAQQSIGETVTVVKSASEMLITSRPKRNGKYFIFFVSHILSLVKKMRQDVTQAGVWYLEMTGKNTKKHFAMFGGKGFNPTTAFSGERAQAFSAN